jgi:hypothetical protein
MMHFADKLRRFIDPSGACNLGTNLRSILLKKKLVEPFSDQHTSTPDRVDTKNPNSPELLSWSVRLVRTEASRKSTSTISGDTPSGMVSLEVL